MAEFPALPLFTDAYMADTRHLSAAQHGAYLLLLMTAWRMPDCKLPDDDKFLARCAAMDVRTWRSNRPIVMAFWHKDAEQKWYQRRLLDERNYSAELSSKNSIAGKASALKRKNRHSASVATKTQPEFNPLTLPTKEKENPIVPKIGFDSFWKVYPKKEAKREALKAYMRAKVEDSVLMEALLRYVDSVKGKDRQYIPLPSTWLNQGRWEDEIITQKIIPPKGSGAIVV